MLVHLGQLHLDYTRIIHIEPPVGGAVFGVLVEVERVDPRAQPWGTDSTRMIRAHQGAEIRRALSHLFKIY